MKFRSIVLVLLILFLSFGIAFADAPINFLEGDIAQKLNHAFLSQVNIVGNKTGVTTNVSTESNLTSAALAYAVIQLQSGSTKSISIANGVAGQMVTLIMTSNNGGGCVTTLTDDGLSAATAALLYKTGWDDIVFDAVGDQVTLLYVDNTTGWIIVGQVGCAITQ